MDKEEDTFSRYLQPNTQKPDPELLHHYFCSTGGFEHEEHGFRVWIPYFNCPKGERCHYASPWFPPLTLSQFQLCAEYIGSLEEQLISEARNKEMMDRTKQ